MIRVLIVDDHPLMRRGLRETLESAAGMKVVGEATRCEEVLGAMRTAPCDIVLLDLSLPGRGGLDVLKDIGREWPAIPVLIVSSYAESQYALRAIQAGAAGYLSKTAVAEELVDAVRGAVKTGRYINDVVGAELARFASRGNAGPAHDRLSDRERQVLQLLVAGRGVSEIAVAISLSVKTVSTYRSRLMHKLGVHTTADLVRYAIEHRLDE
jgi:two-component system, NarL family, invasion response regulator UvrY